VLYRHEIRGLNIDCISNLQVIVDGCENIELKKARNIEYKGKDNIIDLCYAAAKDKEVDLENPEYKERFDRELKLIIEKGYGDYLLVVADLINAAKKFCLVGGGRGSSAGSLICYLLNITEVDPLKHGLIFERFIDINRYDPPDVDTDFPDNMRLKVTRYLENTYGKDNVKTISTISKWKPKVTIGEFAKHMEIPRFETEAVKDVIIERAGGDARAQFCLEDTLQGTDVGKEFLEKFPQMINVKYAEGHAKQKGKHAAGIIVCNEPIVEYCGIDERDGTALLDKKDAEKLNLLKIDVLGLRTLAVLQDCAKMIGMDYKEYYRLPLDDEKAYKVFQSKRLGGVFQFEGEAMASINDSAPMERFSDIVAAGALGRPGALSSGGTSRYVQLRNGTREPLYYCPKHKKITEETYGIVIYQEQMMFLCRDIAGMSWEDVSDLRKAASKSLGEEFFDKYRIKFVEGACSLSGYDEETANKAWLDISSMGSYAFNKSHSVVYGQISYWTAYMKSHYPLQFIASILNNAKDDDSSLKILREFYESENLVYKAVDPWKSNTKWEIVNGELIGGLTNIKGIGSTTALKMMKIRKEYLKDGTKMTPAMKRHFDNPKTPFDILYPARHHWGDIYRNPQEYGLASIDYIKDVEESREYAIIGKMIHVDDVDVNDVQSIAKRGGEVLDGPNMKVHIRLEDDTGVIMCIVNRFIYDKLSAEFLREKVGDTWYCVTGKVMPGAKILFIKEVANLNRDIGLNESEEQR
jgi:DNA-directed DNA polymerase III PolC